MIGPPCSARAILSSSASIAVTLAVAAFPGVCRADRDVEEKLLEDKHKHGDYGFWFGAHDPWDPQVDERAPGVSESGTLLYPLGFKMRFRWRERYFLEGELSYAKRGEEPVEFISTLAAPEMDELTIAASFQGMLRTSGLMRPYLGAGGIFVSISRDFVIDLARVIPEVEGTIDQYQFGGWSEMDVGLQAHVGVDFRLGMRAFPFVEGRLLWGTLNIDSINVGGFRYSPTALGVSSTYEYTGPVILGGLKIHF
jgi:hypothetical protein